MDSYAETKKAVAAYWDRRPCGAKHARGLAGSPQFFAEVEDARERLEPFIAQHAQFPTTRGQDVLEVGCGLGTDLVRFARSGAHVTGVDLSARSVELVRQRLALEGLQGDVRVADAAALPFPDRSFDVAYSWGVLHHTPDTVQAISELFRVLKPGGRFCVMLYARRSWFSFGVWVRYGLFRAQPYRSPSAVLAEHLESAGTQAFTRQEVVEMLAPHSTELEVSQLVTPYDRRVAGPLAQVSPTWLGWFLVANGRR